MTLVMGTIFFLSHQSGDSFHLPTFPGADKLIHFLAYGSLAFTVLWYYGEKGLNNIGCTACFAVFFCLLYGLSDEYHQSFIAFRSVSGFDLLADTAGAVCVSTFWMKSALMRQHILFWQEGITRKLRPSDMEF